MMIGDGVHGHLPQLLAEACCTVRWIQLPGIPHGPKWCSPRDRKAGTRGGLCLEIYIEYSALESRLTCEVNFLEDDQVIMKAVLIMGEEVSCYQFNPPLFWLI